MQPVDRRQMEEAHSITDPTEQLSERVCLQLAVVSTGRRNKRACHRSGECLLVDLKRTSPARARSRIMRLRPIRPPARLPTLWQRHPELAPPRRGANAAFRGRSSIGWTMHPISGASSLRRAHQARHPLQSAKSRWRQPMPSSRRRTHAVASRPPDARNNAIPVDHGKMPWYFEKAHRNRIRRHLKAGERQLARREAEAQRAIAFISQAMREGWATADLVGRLYRAGDKIRPYRPQDVACAAGAFLTLDVQRSASTVAFRGIRFRTST